MRTSRILIGLIAVSFVAMSGLAPGGARAQLQADPPEYRSAVDDAVREFSLQNFEEARASFARAHELSPSARTLRGLGMAEFELRAYAECIEHLEAALRSSVRPLEGSMRAETEQLLARASRFVGRIVVESEPAASELRVDGVLVELPADRTLILMVGKHALEARTAGYAPEQRQLDVRGGERRTLHIVFSGALAAEPFAPAEAPAAPSVSPVAGAGRVRLYAGPHLGLGGSLRQGQRALGLNVGAGIELGLELLLVQYFGLGVEARYLALHGQAAPADGTKLWAVSLRPSARYPLLGKRLELYAALPVGLANPKLAPVDGYVWFDKPGAALGALAGVAYFVTRHLGVTLEVGATWHWFHAKDEESLSDFEFKVVQGAIALGFVVAFGRPPS